jgi:hypothetical protein
MIPRKWLLWTTVALGFATGLFLLIDLLLGWSRSFDPEEYAGLMFFLMLAAAVCFGMRWAYDRRIDRVLMNVGTVCCYISSALMTATFIEHEIDLDLWSWRFRDVLFQLIGTFGLLALLGLHWGLLTMLRLDTKGWRRFRQVVKCAASVPVAVLIAFIWEAELVEDIAIGLAGEDISYEVWRVVEMLTVASTMIELNLTGLVVVGAILGVWRRKADEQEWSAVDDVEMRCPTCGTPLTLRRGEGWCGVCGMQLRVQAEPPRCECGYIMHRNPGLKCSECGKPMPFRTKHVRADTYDPDAPEDSS